MCSRSSKAAAATPAQLNNQQVVVAASKRHLGHTTLFRFKLVMGQVEDP